MALRIKDEKSLIDDFGFVKVENKNPDDKSSTLIKAFALGAGDVKRSPTIVVRDGMVAGLVDTFFLEEAGSGIIGFFDIIAKGLISDDQMPFSVPPSYPLGGYGVKVKENVDLIGKYGFRLFAPSGADGAEYRYDGIGDNDRKNGERIFILARNRMIFFVNASAKCLPILYRMAVDVDVEKAI